MGGRQLDLLCANPECRSINDEVYYDPSYGFDSFKCNNCGVFNLIEEKIITKVIYDTTSCPWYTRMGSLPIEQKEVATNVIEHVET